MLSSIAKKRDVMDFISTCTVRFELNLNFMSDLFKAQFCSELFNSLSYL